MEILDEIIDERPKHWAAKYAKWLELSFFSIYLASTISMILGMPYSKPPMFFGCIGWLLTYAIVYPTWLYSLRPSIPKTQFFMFLFSFCSLALYVFWLLLAKATFLDIWSIEQRKVMDVAIDVFRAIAITGIVISFFYSHYIWHRVGKKNPQAYQFARILWLRLFFLVFLFIAAIAFQGIKL